MAQSQKYVNKACEQVLKNVLEFYMNQETVINSLENNFKLWL